MVLTDVNINEVRGKGLGACCQPNVFSAYLSLLIIENPVTIRSAVKENGYQKCFVYTEVYNRS